MGNVTFKAVDALLADVQSDLNRWESQGFTYVEILREVASQGEYAPLYTAVWVRGNRAGKLNTIAASLLRNHTS